LMRNVAVVQLHLNHLKHAEAVGQRAVELHQSILGEEHPLTITSVVHLPRVYVQKQEFDKAEPLTDQALNFSQDLPIEKASPLLPYNLSLLGWLYLEQGDLAKANALCE